MRLFDTGDALEQYLESLPPGQFAPISRYTPLLSNLNNLENISLIKEVHESMPTLEAQSLVMSRLRQIGYEQYALLRTPQCSAVERFVMLLLRATMVEDARIIIAMPFNLIEDAHDIRFFTDLLDKLAIMQQVELLDMKANRHKYLEDCPTCHIIE